MTVYVDDLQLAAAVPNGARVVSGRWSHLLADTGPELDAFAARLGLHPAWIQQPGTASEHYDVTARKRLHALRFGAVAIGYAETGHLITCRRHGIRFDLDLLRRDKAAFYSRLDQVRLDQAWLDPAIDCADPGAGEASAGHRDGTR